MEAAVLFDRHRGVCPLRTTWHHRCGGFTLADAGHIPQRFDSETTTGEADRCSDHSQSELRERPESSLNKIAGTVFGFMLFFRLSNS